MHTLKNAQHVLFYCHSFLSNKTRRYSSGQRGQTVNLLAIAFEGSNPSRRTKYQSLCESMGFVVFSRAGRDSKDGAGTQDERSEGLSASQGRERYIFIHENNRLLTESRRTNIDNTP
jgi:hypothetical protein